MFKKMKMLRHNFSLIELLIVIAIMGALTALILPQFSDVESDAKDTGCDYNNAGTLRYVTMFKAANSVYPTGFHTGMHEAAATNTVGGAGAHAMADVTHQNMTAATTALDLTAASGAGAVALQSLEDAGIKTLAFGTSTAQAASGVQVRQVSGNWFEEFNGASGVAGSEVSIKGEDLATVISTYGTGYALVPLYVASTIDWEKTADGKNSPVSIALTGKCPWLADGAFRYYICFFKVDIDDSDGVDKAKLITSSCPECGILDASAF